MKKLVFFGLVLLSMVSCGSDDSASTSGPRPISFLFVQGDTGYMMSIVYDEKNRIKSIQKELLHYDFFYNGKGQLDHVTSGDSQFQFTYDGNHLSDCVGFDGQTISVTYTGNNTYTIYGSINASLTSDNDLIGVGAVSLTRTAEKGAFANVKSFNGLALYLLDIDSFYYASKKRNKELVVQGELHPFSHTEGDRGLPAVTTLNDIAITYTYSQ